MLGIEHGVVVAAIFVCFESINIHAMGKSIPSPSHRERDRKHQSIAWFCSVIPGELCAIVRVICGETGDLNSSNRDTREEIVLERRYNKLR